MEEITDKYFTRKRVLHAISHFLHYFAQLNGEAFDVGRMSDTLIMEFTFKAKDLGNYLSPHLQSGLTSALAIASMCHDTLMAPSQPDQRAVCGRRWRLRLAVTAWWCSGQNGPQRCLSASNPNTHDARH